MLSSWSLLDLGVVAPLLVPEDQPWGDYFPRGVSHCCSAGDLEKRPQNPVRLGTTRAVEDDL